MLVGDGPALCNQEHRWNRKWGFVGVPVGDPEGGGELQVPVGQQRETDSGLDARLPGSGRFVRTDGEKPDPQGFQLAADLFQLN